MTEEICLFDLDLQQKQVWTHLNFNLIIKVVENLIFLFPSQVGGVCKLSTESSLRRCRTPDGKICSGRGKCNCGICICEAIEPGKFFGPRCECHDWVCATYNGKTCNGAYDPVLIPKVSNVAILPKLLASQRQAQAQHLFWHMFQCTIWYSNSETWLSYLSLLDT